MNTYSKKVMILIIIFNGLNEVILKNNINAAIRRLLPFKKPT